MPAAPRAAPRESFAGWARAAAAEPESRFDGWRPGLLESHVSDDLIRGCRVDKKGKEEFLGGDLARTNLEDVGGVVGQPDPAFVVVFEVVDEEVFLAVLAVVAEGGWVVVVDGGADVTCDGVSDAAGAVLDVVGEAAEFVLRGRVGGLLLRRHLSRWWCDVTCRDVRGVDHLRSAMKRGNEREW